LSVSDYIKGLLSFEIYAFSLEEVITKSSKSSIAVKRELSRLVEKGEIINLRKGFYLIIPPRYTFTGKLPVELYVEKLFQYLDRKYYLSLYSAAKFHGAAHQQPQRDYLMIEKPKLKAIRKNTISIDYFTVNYWPSDSSIEQRQADAGIFKISSPALTMLDLIHHHNKIGGINRTLSALVELSEVLTEDDIESLLSWYPYKSTLQRIGFLQEELLGTNSFSKAIYARLSEQSFYPVLLSPRSEQNPGRVDRKWKVDVNLKLESDL
jgi:predicted transcriptional regulator of viral defense system